MNIPEICIRRPVLSTVISLIIILIGLVSYDRLTVREYPNIDEPIVTVETTYTGASAEIMETQVTQPLEDSLSGIEGIDFMTSTSREGSSQITITFNIERNVDLAANDVRDRVARTRDLLPDEVDDPIVSKVEADARPIIYLAFRSDRHSALEVSDYADRYVKDRLQVLTGVADVPIFGERRYTMRIWLDKARLAAYSLTPQDIENALREQNIEVPAGRIESEKREFTVLSETDLQEASEFKNMIIRDDEGYLVRLSDVAKVKLDSQEVRRLSRFKGDSAVALGIVKQSVANPLDVSDALKEVLPQIRADLPEGMDVQVAYDSSIFIDKSIAAVYETIIIAILLVIVVIFFFLGTIRATFIPIVTIPISLIGAMAFLYALGFTINTLTLLAMVMAVGMVVDDAIVVLENIFRHIEEGKKPLKAAMVGMREIVFPVIATTAALVAVYIPIGLMEGRTGRLFTEFALALAGAVIVSMFVALTLTPTMCGRLIKNAKKPQYYKSIDGFLEKLSNWYGKALDKALTWRKVVLMVGIVVSAIGGYFLTILPSELAPTEDRGTIIGIGIGPQGATLDYTDRYMSMMEGMYADIPEVERYFVIAGFPTVERVISFVGLKPWEERERKQQAIVSELAPKMFGGIPGMLAFPTNPPSLGASGGDKPLQIVIQSSSRSYEELEGDVNKLVEEISQKQGLTAIDTDLRLDKPQVKVNVNRDKAATLGVDMATLGRTLETMLGGRQVTRFERGNEQYDVFVQVLEEQRTRPSDIDGIYVRAQSGQMIPLETIVNIVETVAPKELNHFNKMRAVTLSANLTGDLTLGEAVTYVEQKAREILPDDVSLDYVGQTRELKDSSASVLITFILALMFIFLVLAAQFESFVDPLIIMLSVPLSIAGALMTMSFTGMTMNIYSQIGLVTLIGLITKHGILIVEFGNNLQDEGKHRREAIFEAAKIRFRPVLMTTAATVLGALPLAIATGAGAESRNAIGWTIVGGMSFGTLFTLFVVPTFYTFAASRKWQQTEEDDILAQDEQAEAR